MSMCHGPEYLRIIYWPDYTAMSQWIATRGTAASGLLTPPPGDRDCRTWQEDQVLARLITSPSDAPLIAAAVPPGTFTTDVRYDIYQAIIQVRNHGSYTPDDVSAEAVDTPDEPDESSEGDIGGSFGGGLPPPGGVRKYYVNDVPVSVATERVQYLDEHGKLITESLRDY